MNKRGFIGLIVMIIILLVIGFFLFTKNYYSSEETEQISNDSIECKTNTDCVPDSCCHPKGCIAIENKPDCQGVFCTMSCEPDTLDCGQGSCNCINGKCGVNK
jgi:hypothetical protein